MIKIFILFLLTQVVYAPILEVPVYHKTNLILEFDGFKVGWNTDFKAPVWAYYQLEASDKGLSLKRPLEPFKRDPRVHNRNISTELYTNSGFDRGHLVPSRAMGSYYGLKAQLQTYFLSNIVPQEPNLNRRDIRNIESRIHDFDFFQDAEIQDIYITINYSQNKIKNQISIPENFVFSVISTDFDENKAIKTFFFLINKK
jgi:DNA/RNA endonuclease G (NUC1)